MLSLLPFCKEAPLSSRFGSYCLHFPIPAASTRASTGFLWHSPHFLPVSAHCPLSKPPCILNFCNCSTHLLVPKSVLISYCSREYTLNLSELNTNNHLLSFIWHSSFFGAGILKQLSLLVTAGSLLLCCSQDAIPDCGYSNLDMAKGSASQLIQSHGFWADASVPCYEDLSTGLCESTRDPELTSSRGNDSNESKAETTVSFMTSFLVTHHYLWNNLVVTHVSPIHCGRE